MPGPQRCTVSYRDPNAIAHSVEVSAESLFEAVCRGLEAFRQAELMDCTPGLGAQLEVSVYGPSTTHAVPSTRLRSWLCSPGGRGPKEVLDKERLRALVPWLTDGASVPQRPPKDR